MTSFHRRLPTLRSRALAAPLALAFLLCAPPSCAGFPDTAPQTAVVLENHYAGADAPVIYDAAWQNVSFQGNPVSPGSATSPQITVPASADNRAYVVLAPGWDPTSTTPPSQMVVLQSRAGFAVRLDDTLHIPVDDTSFAGNCAAGSALPQDQADFIAGRVFAADFAGLRYDAATCTTSGGP